MNYFRSFTKYMTMSNMQDIKTFVFLDLETTGLPVMENNRTKITELCMIAVEASHIGLGVFPRVQNKLSFCFNPWKMISLESEKMTGLSNSILERQSSFSSETVDTINSFLNHNQKPICFVAHNGNYFDYPILLRQIQNTGNSLILGIVCIDSLQAFKQLYEQDVQVIEEDNLIPSGSKQMTDVVLSPTENDEAVSEDESRLSEKILNAKMLNETTPKKKTLEYFPPISSPAKRIKLESSNRRFNCEVSFKLADVYIRLTKRSPLTQHHAESDVTMLITCAAVLGDKFVNWARTNATNFCDIPPMVPGKRIGT